jgi:hypothetical protein
MMNSQSPATGTVEVSRDELMRNTAAIAQWIRLSAQPAEHEAAEYIQKTLESYGIETVVHEPDILVSFPKSAIVKVVEPEELTFEAFTHSFATSTPEGGLTAEVVYVGTGHPGDYEGKDVRGKIVLIDGLAAPGMAWNAEQAGAAAQLFISGERLHYMIVTTIWGTPTPETAHRIPKLPSASIRRDDGNRLKALLERGPVRVRLETETWTGWSKARMVEGRIDAEGSEEWVLLSGHLDSWEYGAMDNGTANATMMEAARVLAERRNELRRGVRVVFWSGHSHGRYAGSTWYVDEFWQEMYDHCVAHVNVDSTGAMGATSYTEAHGMSDVAGFVSNVVRDVTGQTPHVGRMGRNSDQSFWGLGIPAMFGMVSRVPEDQTTEASSGLASLGIVGMPWWWHTIEDTIDKIDPEVLALDTQIITAATLRLCTAPVLPFDYTRMAAEMAGIVAEIQAKTNSQFDLGPVARELERVRVAAERLNAAARQASDEASQARINRALVRLGRHLIPLNYTQAGPYDQDLALGVASFPALRPVGQLAAMDPNSDEYRFLKTRLMRERNRVVHILREAAAAVDETLAVVGNAGETGGGR